MATIIDPGAAGGRGAEGRYFDVVGAGLGDTGGVGALQREQWDA
jgi:hypothetical protein